MTASNNQSPSAELKATKQPDGATAVIMLETGDVIWGRGVGAETRSVGEICFNTSMTGYQEILTDPSYAGQIITFTFPHIGNVGANPEDLETATPASRGCILRADITEPSNYRAISHLDGWLKAHDLPGITGVDTRALTRKIRDHGAPKGVLQHAPDGVFDLDRLFAEATGWSGLNGLDLAKDVSCTQTYHWTETVWRREHGFGVQENPVRKVVAVDFGAKRNILRCLAAAGCDVTVVPATATAEEIMTHDPDGVFLSNGPGDPAATGVYAAAMVKELLEMNMPIFGICLGHQILSLALGAETEKMHLGHRGGNHPVKDLETGKVEITSQNHGFVVKTDTLPENLELSHISLFDGTLEGVRVKGRPAFSVQYHPEASPGPQDSHHLFKRFIDMIDASKAA